MAIASFYDLPPEIKRKILEYLLDLNYGFIANKSFKNLLNLRRTCRRMNEHVSSADISFRLGVLLNISPRNETVYYFSGIPIEDKEQISSRLFQIIGRKTNWRCNYLKVKMDVIVATHVNEEVVEGMPEEFEDLFDHVARVCEGSVKYFALIDFDISLRPLIESIFDRIADRCFLDFMDINIQMTSFCQPRSGDLSFIPEKHRRKVASLHLENRYSFSELDEQDFVALNKLIPSLNTLRLENVKSVTLLSPLCNLTRLELESFPSSAVPDNFELIFVSALVIFRQEGDPAFLPRVLQNCFPCLRSLHLVPDGWSSAWNNLSFSGLPECCDTLCTTYSIMDSFRHCRNLKKVRIRRGREDRDFFSVGDLTRFSWNLELLLIGLFCHSEEQFHLYFRPFMHFFNLQKQLKVLSIDSIGFYDANLITQFIVEHQIDIYNHPSIRYFKIGPLEILDRPLDPVLNSWISKMQETVDVNPRWVIRLEDHRPTTLRDL